MRKAVLISVLLVCVCVISTFSQAPTTGGCCGGGDGTLPAQGSQADKYLATNGTAAAWRALVAGGSGALSVTHISSEASFDIVPAVVPTKSAANNWTGLNTWALQHDLTEISVPANPAADTARLYAKDDSGTTKLCFKDSAGVETCIGSGGSGGGETAIRMLPDDAKFGGTVTAALLECPEWCQVLFSTGDEAIWAWRVPDHYTGTLTAEVQYKMVSATTNNTEWGSELKCVTPGDATDLDAKSFATQNTSADDTVPGTAGYMAEHTWTITNDDSIAAGDFCSFRLERTTPTGSDATGDAELLGVALTW